MTTSSSQNAFETELTTQFGPSDLVADVVSKGALTSPCWLVLEPDSDTQREVVWFDGVFGALSFITTGIGNRYLEGSAQASNLTHPIGSKVRSVPVSQQWDEIHARVDSLDHGNLIGLGDNDHPQYVLDTDHTVGVHDLMNIDADTVDGQHASEFAGTAHDHDADYAAASHVGAGGAAHADVVASGADGFMTGADKAKLNGIEAGAEVNVPPIDASAMIYMKAQADDTQLVISTVDTLRHSFTFTKPVGWNSYTLAVMATVSFTNVSFNQELFATAQIDGAPNTVGIGTIVTGLSMSQGHTTIATSGTKTGRTTNATVGVLVRRTGGSNDPTLVNTTYLLIATRVS